MKGIILAGWSGTRLAPITFWISKQLMPIYDKPMIYYPLSVLMGAGIKEILIITTPEDAPNFQRLLCDGKKWGIQISYEIQERPEWLAQAFIIGEKFIGNDDVCLILWDNLFYGQGLFTLLEWAIHTVSKEKKSVIFWYEVQDPERYGVVAFDDQKNAISIIEKPSSPLSNYAVVGIYFYTNDVIEIAKNIRPSERWELEITSVNQVYLEKKSLQVEIMSRGYAWLDTGTHESMLDASNFIQIIETRQGLKIGCPEEIAFSRWWISQKEIQELAQSLKKSNYGKYLLKISQ